MCGDDGERTTEEAMGTSTLGGIPQGHVPQAGGWAPTAGLLLLIRDHSGCIS